MEDVEKITNCKLFTLCAIYELYVIFIECGQGYAKFIKSITQSPLSSIKKNVFDAATKKLYFYFLWANQLDEIVLSFINGDVKREITERFQYYESMNTKNEIKISPV